MKTLWHQRTQLHPSFEKLDRSLEEDWFLLTEELEQQRAHIQALHAAGLLGEADLAPLFEALDALAAEHGDAPCPASDAEDLHTWVEFELVARCGELGRRVHAGRSRNDQVATLLVLYARHAAERQMQQLDALVHTLATRAEAWAELSMPWLTHTQFAAPGTAGAWALRYAVAFAQRRRTLEHLHAEWSRRCPLGSGAVAGSSLPIDRRVQAAALGFEAPSPSALLSTGGRDECLELLAACAHMALHLSGFASDIILFAQTPYAWVSYPLAFGSGSSMMPNKANPDAMELLRGHANGVASAHAEALGLLRGLPSGYHRDLQLIKPVVQRATNSLESCLDLLIAFVPQMEWNEERLDAAMRIGNLGATFAMEARVSCGEAQRAAHAEVASTLGHSAGTSMDCDRYETLGSAKPGETRRISRELLE